LESAWESESESESD